MFDVALSSAGAQVALSTSSDDCHPPEHMIDGSEETFWTTTGLFPQEVVIRFQALMSISKVEITSYNVQNLALETCDNENADAFQPLIEKELDFTDHQLQQEEISFGEKKAHCLRVVINSAHDHFVSIHKLKVTGNALNR